MRSCCPARAAGCTHIYNQFVIRVPERDAASARIFRATGLAPRCITRCRSTCSPVSASWGIRPDHFLSQRPRLAKCWHCRFTASSASAAGVGRRGDSHVLSPESMNHMDLLQRIKSGHSTSRNHRTRIRRIAARGRVREGRTARRRVRRRPVEGRRARAPDAVTYQTFPPRSWPPSSRPGPSAQQPISASLQNVDVIDICVPTPLRKTRDPDLSYVVKAIEATAAVLRRGQLVILESTTYPGTTEEVAQPALEAGGLKVGRDFYLAFSPERVDPGQSDIYDPEHPEGRRRDR